MKNRKLGSYTVSEIIYGMWRVISVGITTDELIEFLENLKNLGVTAIDTAAIYGVAYHKAEEALGKAILKKPEIKDDFVIISKCGIEVRNETPHYDNTKDYIIKQVTESLEAMHIDQLDILLLHRPDIFMDFDEVYQAFKYLQEKKLVVEFGVSNYTPIQFKSLNTYLSKRGIKLVTNQIEVNNFCIEHYENDNVFYLKGEEITPMIWSPLGGGKLFEDNEIANGMKVIAKKYDVTVSEVAISYLANQGLNPVILLGSHEIKHFETALKGIELELTREDMYFIFKLLTKVNVR